MNSKFKVGDKVFCFKNGWGTVINMLGERLIEVTFDVSSYNNLKFYTCGKDEIYDYAPSLFTVKEAAKFGYHLPKKKVKETIEIWVSVYSGESYCIHKSEATAAENAAKYGGKCVRLIGEYEVEE